MPLSRDDIVTRSSPTYEPVPGIVVASPSSTSTTTSATSYRKTTAKTVNTTTTATDLLNGEITIAAGALGTTGLLRLTTWGDCLNNSGGAVIHPQFQAILGGTTLTDTGSAGTLNSGATRAGWRICVEILNLGAANAQMTSFIMHLSTPIGTTVGVSHPVTTGEGYVIGIPSGSFTNQGLVVAEIVNTGTAVDTSVATSLVLNVINGSASASYETKLLGALVEIV